jgi:hypothetical protein
MPEKLVTVDLPPGLYHNGTKLQAAGRWYDGNRIRFHEGTRQPIGGWVQRVLTGVTITGRPNAAIAWETALVGAPKRLAIGTSTGLFAVNESNVVFNILPGGLTGGTPYRWTFAVFGSFLLASYAVDSLQVGWTRNVLIWDGNTGGPAQFADNGTGTLPFYVYSCAATPERFCILLGGSDAAGVMRRAPTGGAVFDPAGGSVNGVASGGTPVPAGQLLFDPAGGGIRN